MQFVFSMGQQSSSLRQGSSHHCSPPLPLPPRGTVMTRPSPQLSETLVAGAFSAVIAVQAALVQRLNLPPAFNFACAFSTSFLLLAAHREMQNTQDNKVAEANPDAEVVADEITNDVGSDDEDDEEMERKRWLISGLKREDEKRVNLRFSRACGVCENDNPENRFTYSTCAHAVCRKCSGQALEFGENATDLLQICRCCATAGRLVRLYEEEVGLEPGNEGIAPSAPRFSRMCSVCYTESPRRRAVFTACGHIICRACAWQLAIEADDWDGEAHADDAYEAYHDSDDDMWDDWNSGRGPFSGPECRDAEISVAVENEIWSSFDCEENEDAVAAAAADTDSEYEEDSEGEVEDEEEWRPLACPICKTEGGFGPLQEEIERGDG